MLYDMEEVLRTTDPTIISFASALLRAEDIEPFVLDVHMSVLEGGIGVFPRRMMVAKEDIELAREILIANKIDISEAS